MNIVFFGTPIYAIPIAEALYKYFPKKEGHTLAVVTKSPSPAGRNQQLEYSAVDKWAFRKKIKIFYELGEIPEADLGIVASYGKIIPENVIKKFKYSILNIHPSLLPKYRGASPIQAAMVANEKTTGVSVIKMDEKMDHGPIVSSFKEEIKESDTGETLRERLFEKSATFVISLIPNYLKGKTTLKEQDHGVASFTKVIEKEDGFLPANYLKAATSGQKLENGNWNIKFINNFSIKPDALTIYNFIRAMQPWPSAWTELAISDNQEKRRKLKILKANLEEDSLVLDLVQLEGKNPVSWKQFRQGYPEAKFGD